jgi:choline dehydrogenase
VQDISRREFLRGSIAGGIGLGLVGLPWKSHAAEFDYVIVGAGASGCVVASRLSARGYNVLLLEAGPMIDLQNEIHQAIYRTDLISLFTVWTPELAWILQTEPESKLEDRRVPLLAGKVVGGGSSINGRIFIRGDRRDYDDWNVDGWGYEDVLPYFKKLETYTGAHPNPDKRGARGPLPIIELPVYSDASKRFVAAAGNLGFKAGWDINGTQRLTDAADFTEANTYPDGHPRARTRASTETAYILPILGRPNFSLWAGVQVTRVLLEGTRAVGVEFLHDGSTYQAHASSEVIVSAGAYHTPKLLMLSGIGPARHLRSSGVQVAVNLPGVGNNLQDHALVQLDFVSRDSSGNLIEPEEDLMILSEANLFTQVSSDNRRQPPNLQFMFGQFLFPFVAARFGLNFRQGMTMVPVIAKPESTGTVTLRSSNPLDPPVVRHNYLSDGRDVGVLLEGLELGRELYHDSAFDGIRGEEIVPGPDVNTKQELSNYIRENLATVWHHCGSCRMGTDSMAVVDPHLRVYGTQGLRVMDASIMPRVTASNTHSTCVMIGEKGADLILSRKRGKGR